MLMWILCFKAKYSTLCCTYQYLSPEEGVGDSLMSKQSMKGNNGSGHKLAIYSSSYWIAEHTCLKIDN